MGNDGRRAVVSALSALARSNDYRDRSDAGSGLAGFAEMREADSALVSLLLDPEDTFVTRRTADALLRRKDAVGLRIVAAALAVADDNHADWIESTVVDVFGIYSRDLETARRICEQISADSSPRIAAGADRLRATLSEITPALRPA